MGNQCPQGFILDGGSCRLQCPVDFTYANGKCVHDKFSDKSFVVNKLPEVGAPAGAYEEESKRLREDYDKIIAEIKAEELRVQNVQEYDRIQSEYAAYTEGADALKETVDIVKPMRPPTAPAVDIAKERKAILSSSTDLLFIQVSLFLIILSLLTYLFVPTSYAHLVVFLLLCVGVGLGFFLLRK